MATHSSILSWRIPVDRGAWQAIVHGVAKSRTWLSHNTAQSTHLCVGTLIILVLSYTWGNWMDQNREAQGGPELIIQVKVLQSQPRYSLGQVIFSEGDHDQKWHGQDTGTKPVVGKLIICTQSWECSANNPHQTLSGRSHSLSIWRRWKEGAR